MNEILSYFKRIKHVKEEYLISEAVIVFSLVTLFHEHFQNKIIFFVLLGISFICILLHFFSFNGYQRLYKGTYFILCFLIVIDVFIMCHPLNLLFFSYNMITLAVNTIFLFAIIYHSIKVNVHFKRAS